MQDLTNLDFVARNYHSILIDTCALQSIDLKSEEKDICYSDIDFKKELQKDEYMFLDFLKKKRENDSNFYFPPSVLPEINPISCKFNYKRFIKKVNELDRYDTKLLRLIKNNKKLKRLLADNDSDSIIHFNSLEIKLYDSIKDEYPYLPLKDKYKISPVDYDFLISGVVLFCTRGSTALLSNDLGIFSAMKKISYRSIKNRRFDFFLRKNFPYVERLS